MWCQICEQGNVILAIIKQLKQKIWLCDECEATWFKECNINSSDFIRYSVYMKSKDLPPLWDELELLDEPSS